MKGKSSILIKTVAILNILLLFCIAATIIYSLYLYHKSNNYQPINKPLQNITPQINMQLQMENIDIPSKEITLLSSISLNEDELTNLFLLSLSNMPNIKQYIQDLKVRINGNHINLDANITYKDLPLQATFTFEGKVSSGKGVLHYKEGKAGLFTIPQDIIMYNLKGNPYLRMSEGSSDIILDIFPSDYVEVINISTENNILKVNFRGTMALLK